MAFLLKVRKFCYRYDNGMALSEWKMVLPFTTTISIIIDEQLQ